MRNGEELRALATAAADQYQREVGAELTDSLMKEVATKLFDEAAVRFIKQRIGHLQIRDLHNLIKVLDGQRDEESTDATGETGQTPERRGRGRPRKGSAEGTEKQSGS